MESCLADVSYRHIHAALDFSGHHLCDFIFFLIWPMNAKPHLDKITNDLVRLHTPILNSSSSVCGVCVCVVVVVVEIIMIEDSIVPSIRLGKIFNHREREL